MDRPVDVRGRRTRTAPTTSTSTTASSVAARAYDHVIVSPVGKTGRRRRSTSRSATSRPIQLTGANGLIGARAGQTAGHYVKLISLTPDGSQFKLYLTSLTRAIARCSTAACNALPAGGDR